jgi:hypothetical protein
VFKLRSVSNIVIAPANTGKDKSNKITVIFADHTKRGTRSNVIPLARILMIVEIKLIAPKIEEIPAKWREKMVISTEAPLCEMFADKGGYTVHPVPAPLSTAAELKSRVSEGGRSQNLMLFKRGNAMSGAPSISGINQLPNPPIIIGITMKKIIIKA